MRVKERRRLICPIVMATALICLQALPPSATWVHANDSADEAMAPAYMYRYKSASGHMTMSSQVPTESLKLGYDVLNKHLEVIRTVPPAMTEKEKTALEASRKKQAQEARLLKSFASAADAERARDRKLNALDVIIKITRGNITRLNLDYENFASDAASYQRAGKDIPGGLTDNMQNIEKQIAEAELFIESKLEEKDSIEQKYNEDIEQLRNIESRDRPGSKHSLTN